MPADKIGSGKSISLQLGVHLGLVLFFCVIFFLNLEPGKPIVTCMAAVAVLMPVWWITDAIPIFATALLPMVLYPLMGILTTKATAQIYINRSIFHDISIHGRFHDRFDHGELESSQAHRAFYHPHHRWRTVPHCFGIYAGQGLLVHVDI